MPSLATEVVSTARVRRVANVRGRGGAIASDRHHRQVESALSCIRQAAALAVNGEANYKRFAQHLQAVQHEEKVAPTRFNAQIVPGRRAHDDGGPSGGAAPSARNTRARSVSQDSRASVDSLVLCRCDSRLSDEEEE